MRKTYLKEVVGSHGRGKLVQSNVDGLGIEKA